MIFMGAASRFSQMARKRLKKDFFGDASLRQSLIVLEALPVYNMEHEVHSWFVPVIAGDRLIAFFQFLSDGTFMRFSSFQHHPGEIEDCPLVSYWLDTKRIVTLAEKFRHADEIIGQPFLSFDRTPERIIWAVPLSSPNIEVRNVYVVGDEVYLPSDNDTFG